MFMGSPRKNGNTSKLLNCVEKGLIKRDADYERIFVHPLNVNGCLGCNSCELGKNPCVQKDDMTEIYNKILASDVIVLASPVYTWSITAQLKTVMDRFYGVSDLLKGKKIAVVSTAEGDAFDGLDLIVMMAKKECNFLDMKYLGCLYRAPVGDGSCCYDAQAIEDGDEFAELLIQG